ncbi:hypothetical protein X551_00649 [Methylibium sp. T29]|nr:hypothetical protein X551_00649 [Methylibium sp. T29]
MAHPVGVGREARIGGQLGPPGDLAEAGELRIVADRQDHVAIGDLEHLIGHDVLVRVAGASWHLTAHEVVGAQVGQHRHLRVEQRHIDVLALAATEALGVAVPQGREDADAGIQAGEQVGDRHAHLLRATAGQVVPFAGQAHQAAQPLHRVVVAGTLVIGAGLAVAGDRAVDQLRVQGVQRHEVEAVARHVADLVVLDQHIGLQYQARTSAWPSGCARSIAIERLLRFAPRK